MPQERKLVTVLFADIVDSSRATGAHDPEVVRSRLSSVFSTMRKTLGDHGGTVEKFIGDAVMAVFGIPAAHDDDAERAVRAALALREALTRPTDDPGFELRIGINSGEVVAGDEEHAETLVTGTPVIVASRLQAAAAAGEILVGALTRRLTEDRFRYGPVRTFAAKNIGDLSASAVISPVREFPGRVRRGVAPFIGRASELVRLRQARETVHRTGTSLRVVVTGPGGIGKTSLVAEFERSSGGDPFAWGRCLPYGQAVTLWPLQEIVRGRAGIAAADAADLAQEKLERQLSAAVEPGEGRSIVLRLLALLTGELWSAEIAQDEAQGEIASAVARLLDASHRSGVTTLVFEDLHLAEPVLLETIDELIARAKHPLLVIGVARPELIERSPSWVVATEGIQLGPLRPSEAEQLARVLLERSLDDPLARIVRRSEGNPLYIEELAQVVLDKGDADAVPPTLHGLIAARLDRADPHVKRLLQSGSVLGRDLWLDAIPWDAGWPSVAGCAADAERQGSIVMLEEPGPSGEPTLRFRHGLIRDVAYLSTPKAARARLHDHYARWFSSLPAGRALEFSDTIAFHAEQAFRLAQQVQAQDASHLGRRAFEAVLDAAIAARRRADFHSGLALTERALKLAGEVRVDRDREIEALGVQAMMHLRLDPSGEALAQLDRAIDAARGGGPRAHLVHLLQWRAGIALAEDIVTARALIAEAVEVARAAGDNELIAYALSRSGKIGEATGELEEQARSLTEARDLALRTDARAWLPDTLAELSVNALHRGDLGVSRAHAQEAAGIAADGGSRLQRFKASVALAWSYLAAQDLGAAYAEARSAHDLGSEIGGPWALAQGAEVFAAVLSAREELAEARSVLDEVAVRIHPATTPAMRSHVARIHASLSRVQLRLGDMAAARRAAETARAVAPATDVRARAVAGAALAHVEMASGNASEATRSLEAALRTVEHTGYHSLADSLRAELAALATPTGQSAVR